MELAGELSAVPRDQVPCCEEAHCCCMHVQVGGDIVCVCVCVCVCLTVWPS